MENKELVPIGQQTIGGKVVQTVNARLLHEFLEVGRDFSNWIKDRIESFKFVENLDYVLTVAKIGERKNVKVTEYHLTLDMAKELSMVERNDKGKQARQYFIECERLAKQATIDPMQILNDPAAMRGLLLNYSEKVITLETKVADLEPKAQALDMLVTTEGLYNLTVSAKLLQMRRKDFIAKMHADRYIYRSPGGRWIAHSEKMRQGLLEHRIYSFKDENGLDRTEPQVLLTPKCLRKLALQFNKTLDLPASATTGGADADNQGGANHG